MYTMENQQIFWNEEYRKLNQGIVTGAKHSVPLANILLSFIIMDLIQKDVVFSKIFYNNLKLWNRFIDDCVGIFLGRKKIFQKFLQKLSNQFEKHELQITSETSQESIVVLDIEIYKFQNKLHTKEHRKETASSSYLKYGSAHPKFIYKGIVKSQLLRLRRLCSRDFDFDIAVKQLRERGLNSGYDVELIDEILSTSSNLVRNISPVPKTSVETNEVIRWITLSNSLFDNEISEFLKRTNMNLQPLSIKIENVKTTGPTLSKLLFNNNGNKKANHMCGNCNICTNRRRGDENNIFSTTRNVSYKIDKNLSCTRSGIYCIKCGCVIQYTGKTSIPFNVRFPEHFDKNKGSAIFEHSKTCIKGKSMSDYNIQFLEDVWNRGKYSLSEREYLWNHRLKGSLNIQKTLKS